MSHHHVGLACLAVALWMGLLVPSAWAQLDGLFEEPPTVHLDEVLPSALIRSPHHRVHDEVGTRGHVLEFRIDSDHGSYRVESVAMVALRVQEIETLAQAIDHFQRENEQLATELRGVMRVGADSWVDILTSPLKTASSVVGQFGNNVGQTFTELGQAGSDINRGLRPGVNIYEQTMPSDPVLAAHKRNVASQLNLDVYSSNTRVQEFLNTLAIARGSGQRSAGMQAVSLPHSPVRRVNKGAVDNAARSAVNRMTPQELYRRNQRRLEAAGVPEKAVHPFLSHPRLSPTHKTLLTEYVAFLDGVGGREALVAVAMQTRTEEEALGHVNSARMLALYHEGEERLGHLISAGHVVLAVSVKGAILVVLPFDLLFWDRRSEDIFAGVSGFAADKGYRERVLLLGGSATQLARRQLEEIEIEIRERYPYR